MAVSRSTTIDVLAGFCRRELGAVESYRKALSSLPIGSHTSVLAACLRSHEQHAEFYDLMREFDRRTGCPVLINTSFNVRGEPIVCTPDDAYLCFMRSEMDALVLGNQILLKGDQPKLVENFDWRERFELD